MNHVTSGNSKGRGVLRALARDTRGNVLVIMVAALPVLVVLTGSAVDMSRTYVVRSRLQHACDAGALAGRRAMTNFSTASTQLDAVAAKQANDFFYNNFPNSPGAKGTPWMGTKQISLAFTKHAAGDQATSANYANVVTGEAVYEVPMTIMSAVLDHKQLTVTCQAESDMADADTVFVLDMSNSMACAPGKPCPDKPQAITYDDGTTGFISQESADSKLEQVRLAVLKYDDTIHSNADKTAHFRYGFAPYSSSVNIGKLLYNADPDLSFIDTGTGAYQSRTPALTGNSDIHSNDYTVSGTSARAAFPVGKAACNSATSPLRLPGGDATTTGYSTGYTYVDSAGNQTVANYPASLVFTGARTFQAANGTPNIGTCTATAASGGTLVVQRIKWTYTQVTYKLADYVRSGNPANPVAANPSRADGMASTRWRGCVEEAYSTASLTPLPQDLDPDFVPGSTNKWRPMWPDVVWYRGTTAASKTYKDENVKDQPTETGTYDSDPQNFNYMGASAGRDFNRACGAQARRLTEYPKNDGQKALKDYLYSTEFKPSGRTYHDIGMKWGIKLLSNKGVFADSTTWPGRNEPQRYLVFLTDGAMFTPPFAYDEYGIERYDGRVTGSTGETQTNQHIARFSAECAAAKAKGYKVDVVLFAPDDIDHGSKSIASMDTCDSSGHATVVQNGEALVKHFNALATGVAKLRISQ